MDELVPLVAVEDPHPCNLLIPVFEEFLENSFDDGHVLGLRGPNRADQRVDLTLRIALGLLHHQFARHIFVRPDGLNEQKDAQDESRRNEGFKKDELFAFAGHDASNPAQHLYTYLTAELCTEKEGLGNFSSLTEIKDHCCPA